MTEKEMQSIKLAAMSRLIRTALDKKGIPVASDENSIAPTQISKLDEDHKKAQTDDLRTDTKLKKDYAYWFIGILIGQIVIMNLIFICVGAGGLIFSDYVLHLYMGGTLAEVFGVVLVITRYLFPKR